MENFNLDREIARLILLQRSEFTTAFQKKIRKFFGRYLFTNIFSKYLINPKEIGKRYFKEMNNEYSIISNHLDFEKKNFLSIGSGMCGLELIINSKHPEIFFSIIEKNYVSKKVKYGWDQENLEAYNSISKLNFFLRINGMMQDKYSIYDFDNNNLPVEKFDYVISLYSLDYHYDFDLYKDYFRKILNKNSVIIFDTIRPNYFLEVFDYVEVINSVEKKIHQSKRVICRGLKI